MCEDGHVEDGMFERSAVISIGQRASLPPFLTQKFIIFIAYFLHVKGISEKVKVAGPCAFITSLAPLCVYERKEDDMYA
jgi:hypothetical protein